MNEVVTIAPVRKTVHVKAPIVHYAKRLSSSTSRS